MSNLMVRRLAAALLVFNILFISSCAQQPAQQPKQAAQAPAGTLAESHWAAKYVNELLKRGIPLVPAGSKIDPDAKVTIKQFASWLGKALGKSVPEIGPGDSPITRGQVAQTVIRALGKEAEAKNIKEAIIPANDGHKIPADMAGILTLAYQPSLQLLNYRPGRLVAYDQHATLAEAALAIYRAMKPPAQGGVLVRAREVEPAQYNTVLTTSGGSGTLVSYLSDTLVGSARDADGRIVYYPKQLEVIPTLENGLAKVLPNGKLQVTYKFRKNMKWHDGKPVTAEDAVFMWEVINDRKFPAVSRSGFDRMEKINIVNPYEIVVTFKEFYPYYEVGSAQYRTFFLLPKHILEADYRQAKQSGNYEPFITKVAKNAIFSGPYKLKQVKPGEAYIMEANKDYYLGKPSIDELVMRIILDTNVLLASLIKGEVDFHNIYNVDQALSVEKQMPKTLRVEYYPTVNHQLPLALNLRDPKDLSKPHPILGDVTVRRALLHAIDRQAINQAVFGGKCEPSHAWIWSELHPLFNPNLRKYEYDPAKAQKMLDDAGWKVGPDGIRTKGGVRLSLEIVSIAGRSSYEMCEQLLRDQWKKVGVELVINNMPWQVFTSQRRPKGQFDISLGSWGYTEFTDPEAYWHSRAIPTEQNNWSGVNYWGWSNAENDRVLTEATKTIDPAKRKELYWRHLELWVEDLPNLPFLHLSECGIAKRELEGFFAPDHLPGAVDMVPYWYWDK